MPESGVVYPHFAFTLLADMRILVSYQGKEPPQAHEIDNYRQLLASLAEHADIRCMWYTEGPRPSREQQERLRSTVPRHQWLVALVSPSPEMRFVACTFSLTNRNLRYFTPQELPQALRHLHCTLDEQTAVQATLAELRLAVHDPERLGHAAVGHEVPSIFRFRSHRP